jgi:predicted ATPase
MVHRIVLTGAPGSGKTEFLKSLHNDPRLTFFSFLDELARQLLIENPDYRNHWSEFHREIYRQQVAREEALRGKPFVTDRGTVDAFAFHPETLRDVGTTLEKEYLRYTAVFHLETSAALGEQYYARDEVRNESLSDALIIEKALRGAWQHHPDYRFLPATEDADEKYQTLLNFMLDMTIANK